MEVPKHELEADRTLKFGDDQGDKAGGGVFRDRIRSGSVWGIITTNNFRIFVENVCNFFVHIFDVKLVIKILFYHYVAFVSQI